MSRPAPRPLPITATESWRLWCLALTALRYTPAELARLFEKQPQHERELLTRMDTIRRTRAIPVEEFL